MQGKTKLVIVAIAVSVLTVLVSSQVIDLSPYLSASVRFLRARGKTELLEEYSFVFQRIEWVYVDGGISHVDDWEDPLA